MKRISWVKKKIKVTAKSSKKSGKLDDVSKPGDTPASSNARPTITGHQPTIKNDPMVAAADGSGEEEETQGSKRPYINKSKVTIKPISEDLKKDKNKDETDSDKAEPKPEEKAPENDEEPASSSESAAIDALAKTADAKKAESKQEEEDQKHREYIDGLARSGKYSLPIIEGGHKGTAERVVSWILLFLLLSSIGVYLAIDAGYLDIGFNLPLEFIKN